MKKVWIELPKASTVEEAAEYCKLANAMLRKLGVDYDVFWACDAQSYCSTFYNKNDGPEGAGFTECYDRGAWFNLEYLAKEKGE